MHARELVEMAAIVAAHGPATICARSVLSPSGVEHYWAASKCRIERWTRALRAHAEGVAAGRRSRPAQRIVRAVIEEILASEVLTRMWTAITVACDQRADRSEMEPVSRSILVGHLEARNRALALAMQASAIDSETAADLNRLRRQAERWTDLMIGHLLATHDVSEFAADAERAREFASDIEHERRMGSGERAWAMTLTSLRLSFRNGLSPLSPNGDLNEKIAASILSSFPPGLFDSTGIFKSVWLTRMLNTATDAQGLVDELLWMSNAHGAEEPTTSTSLLRRDLGL